MANPVVSLVSYVAPKGNDVGRLVVDADWATYAQNSDVLDLSGIFGKLPGFEPGMVKHGFGFVPATGHAITFAPAASPAVSNVGTLRAWSGTTQVTAGAWDFTARLELLLQRENFS